MGSSANPAKRRRRALLAAVVVVATVVGVGCGSGSSSTTSPSPTAVADQPLFRMGAIAGGGTFDSLNPYNAVTAAALSAFMQMYPALVDFSADLQPQPDLAESWSASADGKTWTFKLRSDAVWSDGKPITASDAVYTINTAVKFKTGVAAGVSPFVVGIKEASAPDATTLVVTLDYPVPALLANIVNLAILPEHVWGPLAGGDGAQLKTLTNDPSKETVVVSGPFTVQKYDPKGTTIFVPVKTYYGQKPLIKGYGLQLFTSPDAAAQALKTGSVDVIFPLTATLAKSLASDTKLEVQGLSKMPQTFAVNNSPNFTKHPELRDVKVREAIDIAIDRQQIVDDVFLGYATPGGSMVYPEYAPTFMSAPLSVPTRDVARANAILDELGYKKGSDGIRAANGHPMKYTVLLWSALAADQRRIFGVLKQNLADVGISLVSEMTDNAWGGFIDNGKYSKYDAWLPVYVENPDPDSALVMFSSLMADSAVSPTGTKNASYDEAYQKTQVQDAAARKAAIDNAVAVLQSIHAEHALVYWDVLAAWDKRWQNVPDVACLFATPSYLSKAAFVRLALQQ
jgi:peptide/nickel transport system substrate-binding protein